MLSGIGPADHLSSLDIPVVVDSPGVGAHLMDHPVIDFNFRDKSKSRMAALTYDPRRHGRFDLALTARALSYFVQWKLYGTGPLSTNVRPVAFSCDTPRTDIDCYCVRRSLRRLRLRAPLIKPSSRRPA